MNSFENSSILRNASITADKADATLRAGTVAGTPAAVAAGAAVGSGVVASFVGGAQVHDMIND